MLIETANTISKATTSKHHFFLEDIPVPALIVADQKIYRYNRHFMHTFFATQNLPDCCNDFFDEFDGLEMCRELPTINYQERIYFHKRIGRHYSLKTSALADEHTLILFFDQNNVMNSAARKYNQSEELIMNSRSYSVGEMATTLAHELNQPLSAIKNYLAVAKTLNPGNQLQLILERALAQADHGATIIKRIREFVQNKEPNFEVGSIRELINRTLDLCRVDIDFLSVQVDIDIAGQLPAVIMDKVMIEQVLSNLLRNASDALLDLPPSQRRIVIGAELTADDKIRVFVRDNGRGMQADIQDQIFNAFFTTKANGMGAGLAICRSFIELHQGRLTFQSQQGTGSEFSFTLLANKEDAVNV